MEWDNVHLQSKDAVKGNITEGPFTFQVILHENGDIVFAYKTVPVVIDLIKDDEHPVKVGLSDAYIIDRTIFCKKRKCLVMKCA